MSTAAKPSPLPLDLQRRPMARAQRVPLIEREIKERLGDAAIEVIFSEAARISEGRVHQNRYFGSTMLTIDLTLLASSLRVDASRSASTYAELFDRDPRVLRRVHRIAERESIMRANAPLADVVIEVRVRADECCIFVDADVEATVRTG